MPGIVGYNQASDMGNAFGGVGDILGSAILRGAMMRQQQNDRQQQLMLEIARLRQEQENASSLNKYRDEEVGLRKKEGEREDTKLGFAKQKADEGVADTAMRQRFATSMRTQGVPQPPGGVGPASPDEERQANAQESAAYISNEPKNALDAILKMQAMQTQPMNPVMAQQIMTGMTLHNVPPGNQPISPAGDPVGQPPPFRPPSAERPQAGQDFSANTLLTEYMKGITAEGGYRNRTNNPVLMQLEPLLNAILTRGMGTNAPAGLQGGAQPQGDGMVEVTNPQGKRVKIKQQQLQDALSQGYKQ